jgi:hypothetical protein
MKTTSKPHRGHGLALAGLLTAASLLSACGAISTLNINDNAATIGSVRAVKRFGSGPGGPGIEVEASQFTAKGTQALANSEVAYLGNQSINGPATLQNTARVTHAQLVYNHLLFAGQPVEMEWFAGAAQVHTHWASTGGATAPRLSATSTWSGPVGGVLGRLRLTPMLSLEGRRSLAMARGGNIENQRLFTEVALALRPVPGLVLRGGYAESQSWDWVRPDLLTTALSVRARGPFLNLGLEF